MVTRATEFQALNALTLKSCFQKCSSFNLSKPSTRLFLKCLLTIRASLKSRTVLRLHGASLCSSVRGVVSVSAGRSPLALCHVYAKMRGLSRKTQTDDMQAGTEILRKNLEGKIRWWTEPPPSRPSLVRIHSQFTVSSHSLACLICCHCISQYFTLIDSHSLICSCSLMISYDCLTPIRFVTFKLSCTCIALTCRRDG